MYTTIIKKHNLMSSAGLQTSVIYETMVSVANNIRLGLAWYVILVSFYGIIRSYM
jgi:hypothetical protein